MVTRRGRLIAGIFVLLVGVGALGVHAVDGRGERSQVRDARAYKISSTRISLDEALRRAGFVVPECLDQSLRYALVDDGFGYHYKIYLRFESSVECVGTFVKTNGMQGLLNDHIAGPEKERLLTYRSAWMDEPPIPQMGWEVGSEQRFQEFSMGNERLYAVTALIQHVAGTSNVRAYVYAFHGG